MTVRTITFCDCCGKECEKGDCISVIIGDGHYWHVHPDCLETNVSNWLTRQSNPELRKQFINVLFGKGGRLCIAPVAPPDPM